RAPKGNGLFVGTKRAEASVKRRFIATNSSTVAHGVTTRRPASPPRSAGATSRDLGDVRESTSKPSRNEFANPPQERVYTSRRWSALIPGRAPRRIRRATLLQCAESAHTTSRKSHAIGCTVSMRGGRTRSSTGSVHEIRVEDLLCCSGALP